MLTSQPPSPGLYLILGPMGLINWALETLTLAFAEQAALVWIDAANRFDIHRVEHAARQAQKDPDKALRSFRVTRPFTAYQLERIVVEDLRPAMQETHALLAVIADPLPLFKDASIQDQYWRYSFQRFVWALETLTQELAIVVLICSDVDPAHRALFRMGKSISYLRQEGERLDFEPVTWSHF